MPKSLIISIVENNGIIIHDAFEKIKSENKVSVIKLNRSDIEFIGLINVTNIYIDDLGFTTSVYKFSKNVRNVFFHIKYFHTPIIIKHDCTNIFFNEESKTMSFHRQFFFDLDPKDNIPANRYKMTIFNVYVLDTHFTKDMDVVKREAIKPSKHKCPDCNCHKVV